MFNRTVKHMKDTMLEVKNLVIEMRDQTNEFIAGFNNVETFLMRKMKYLEDRVFETERQLAVLNNEHTREKNEAAVSIIRQ